MKEFIEKEALEILESDEDCYYKFEFRSIVTRCQGINFLNFLIIRFYERNLVKISE